MKQQFLILVAATALLAQSALATDFKREIPEATWEPIFFESINRLTTRAGWTPLRKEPLPQGSVELRIWIGFGLSPLKGFSLRRDDSKWIGSSIADNGAAKSADVQQVTPKSGWERFWGQLIKLGVITLPDSSALPNEAMLTDGVSYVVEVNQDGHYRTYEYSNPQHQKWPEAKKIRQIAELFYDELARK